MRATLSSMSMPTERWAASYRLIALWVVLRAVASWPWLMPASRRAVRMRLPRLADTGTLPFSMMVFITMNSPPGQGYAPRLRVSYAFVQSRYRRVPLRVKQTSACGTANRFIRGEAIRLFDRVIHGSHADHQ